MADRAEAADEPERAASPTLTPVTPPRRSLGQWLRLDAAKLADLGYALGWALVKRLPERVAAALFRRIADRVTRRRGPRVLRLEANLARVVPDATPERISELAAEGMRSYMRYWLETFRLPTWDQQRVLRTFQPVEVPRLEGPMEEGRGAILALPHMGNYDLAGAWVAAYGYPFTTVAERLKPESLFDRFVAYREGLGMEVLPLTGGERPFATLARRLRTGRLVCMVCERDLSATGVEIDFFGSRATMPAGPALLAMQTGAALLPVTLWYDGGVMRGTVHEEIVPSGEGGRREQAAAMTQQLADVFAGAIAEHPQDWHMLQRFWLADFPGGVRPGARRGGGAEPAAGAELQPEAGG